MLTIDPNTITGIVTVISAIGVLITTIVNAILAVRNRTATAANKVAIEEVHTLVNSYATTQAARIEQLTEDSTRYSGLPAPSSPSMPAGASSPDTKPRL